MTSSFWCVSRVHPKHCSLVWQIFALPLSKELLNFSTLLWVVQVWRFSWLLASLGPYSRWNWNYFWCWMWAQKQMEKTQRRIPLQLQLSLARTSFCDSKVVASKQTNLDWMCCKSGWIQRVQVRISCCRIKKKVWRRRPRSNEWTAVVGIASFFGTTFHVSEFNFNFFGLENILLKRILSSSLDKIQRQRNCSYSGVFSKMVILVVKRYNFTVHRQRRNYILLRGLPLLPFSFPSFRETNLVQKEDKFLNKKIAFLHLLCTYYNSTTETWRRTINYLENISSSTSLYIE